MSNGGHPIFNGLYWLTAIILAVLIGLLAFRVWATALPVQDIFDSRVVAVVNDHQEITL